MYALVTPTLVAMGYYCCCNHHCCCHFTVISNVNHKVESSIFELQKMSSTLEHRLFLREQSLLYVVHVLGSLHCGTDLHAVRKAA
jgi:hypothetical protein